MPKTDVFIDTESTTKPRKRIFEAGQMKLLALHLIAQAPKHGYEIIKGISDLVGGGYCPSAGTIYPTLTYLEEQLWVCVEHSADERKQYIVTDLGLQHLHEQQVAVDQIFSRFDTRRQIQSNDQLLDIKRAMENLKYSLRLKIQHSELSTEEVRLIAEQIDQAAVNIGRL